MSRLSWGKSGTAKRRRTFKSEFAETLRAIVWAAAVAIVIRTFALEPFHIPSDSMIPGLFVGDHLFVSKVSYGYSRQSFPLSLPLIRDRIFFSEPSPGDVIVFKKIRGRPDNYIKRLIGMPGDRIQLKNGRLYINGRAAEREPAGRFFVVNLPFSARRSGFGTVSSKDGRTLTIIGTKELLLDGVPLSGDQYTIAYKDAPNFQGEVVELKKYVETLPNGVKHSIVEIGDDAAMENTLADNTPEYMVPEDHYFMMGDNRDMSQDSRYLDEVGFIHRRDLIGRANIIFFSHNGSVGIFEFWKWLSPIRWERLLKIIR